MSLKKIARCHIRMDSRWVALSAALMGLSVFAHTVHYFGLVNLRDLDGFRLAMEVIGPMVLVGSYLILFKGFRFNSPVLMGGFMALLATNYLVVQKDGAAGIASGVMLVILAVGMIITGLGYLPNSIPVVVAAFALVLVRLIGVDLKGYLLPLEEFRPLAYLPVGANLLSFLAVSLVAPAVTVTRRHTVSAPSAEPEQEPQAVPEEESSNV